MSDQHRTLPQSCVPQSNRAQPSRQPRNPRRAASAFRWPIIAAVLVLGLVVACGTPTAGGSGPTLPEFGDKVPNDEYYESKQWNLPAIEMPRAWGTLFAEEVEQELGSGYPRRDVIVAVLDTEIDISHPDLKDNLVDGYDAIENRAITIQSTGHQSIPTPTAGEPHGTHVAGIIGAVTSSSEHSNEGIAGIGWNQLKIMPVTVLGNDGSGSISTLIDALEFAAGVHDEHKPERTVQVINLSLGLEGQTGPPPEELKRALDSVVNRGITVVAAAGNDGCGSILYPAAYASTIAVGSANPPGNDNNTEEVLRASYSNCGPELELVAPGGNNKSDDAHGYIYSLGISGGSSDYTEKAGTSMAAPHVAGVAGLLYAVSDRMTPELVRRILTETAEPVAAAGSYPSEEYGWGMLNAGRAVRRALMDPYGPYRDDGSATTHYVWPVAPRALDSGVRRLELREEPEPGTYRPDHAILVLNEDWFDRTARADRRARLAEIAERHGLAEIRDRGHRFPTAILPEGKEVDRALLDALEAEAEIESAGYDHYVRPL